jgi:hypothetical protein
MEGLGEAGVGRSGVKGVREEEKAGARILEGEGDGEINNNRK